MLEIELRQLIDFIWLHEDNSGGHKFCIVNPGLTVDSNVNSRWPKSMSPVEEIMRLAFKAVPLFRGAVGKRCILY